MNYLSGGARFSSGFNTLTTAQATSLGLPALGAGGAYEHFGPNVFKAPTGSGVTARFKLPELHGNPIKTLGGYGMPALGIGLSAVNIGLGAYEGGSSGAIQAAYTDLAITSAMRHALYRTDSAGAITSAMRGGVISGPLDRIMSVAGASEGARHTTRQIFSMGRAGIYAGVGMAIGGGSIPGTFLGAYAGGMLARGRGIAGAAALTGAIATKALTSTAVRAGKSFVKAGFEKERMRQRIDTAGSMSSFMTQGAYTQRQRAVMSMHRSHINARSALGREASYMHLNRNYFSDYRRF